MVWSNQFENTIIFSDYWEENVEELYGASAVHVLKVYTVLGEGYFGV